MKQNFLLSCFFISSCLVNAQDASVNANSPYVFPIFQKGTVYLINGDSTMRSMNYNAVTEEMVYDERGRLLALDMPELIKHIRLGENVLIEPRDGKFYQRLANYGDGLFVYYKYKVIPPSSPSAYGGNANTTSTTNWSSLSDNKMLYELSLPNEFKLMKTKEFILFIGQESYKVNRALVKKLFPERADALKSYEKNHKLDLKDPEDVRTFIGICYDKLPVE